MGRRSRARERAATPAPPERAAAERPRRGLLGMLNPFGFQRPGRSRVGFFAVAFALLAAGFAAAGLLTGTGEWFNSAVLLAVLALVWGVRAALMREGDRSS